MNEYDIQQALFYHFQSRSVIAVPNYTPAYWYECDFFQVTTSLYWVEFEIKISLSDFRADFKKTAKHKVLLGSYNGSTGGPRRFWYVVTEEIAERVQAELPAYAGLMTCFSNGLIKIVFKAPCLTSSKLKKTPIPGLLERFYWRFWRQRDTVISLRRDITNLRQGKQHDTETNS